MKSSMTNSQQPMTNRSSRIVRFSPTSLMIVIAYPTLEEKKARWYSTEELSNFKHVLSHDVSKCFGMVDEARLGLLSKDDVMHSIGLESFLAQGLTNYICLMKKVHLHRVLIEQALQTNLNAYSAEELAHASVISSHWSRRRSYAIAVRLMGISA
eukprot:CCRYP_015576-RA/>CCRYP_015576-RA protein AED:0.46 eAED:0.46 QI:0/-1/0/1/-1/1/1/0/154